MFLKNITIFFKKPGMFLCKGRWNHPHTSHYEKRLFEHASQPRVACQILDYFLISGVEQTSRANLAPTADNGIARFSFDTLPCCIKPLDSKCTSFFILVKYCLLRIMKNDYLNMLASLVLPARY